ncbi:TetR/AcrR family transcriptional regulator [Gordonia hydrophobica]|uniref:TetR/AcrR family transcriptional regulator n=1 Tax=Gordonia hydrophobica TaxID=40516 RepID=A0ABZ2TWF0_9ACTN|nr:TetR/AcrR family transcriptional regulator [Gordonia hydrophobica]MBM7365781.1 AcrR family transcriptional regulator [Gordonia hydrophobica]
MPTTGKPTTRKPRITASVPEQEQGILAAAADEFAAVGLRKASMDEVARAAGVSRSTLYRRFPDKDALIHAVARESFETGLSRLEDLVAGMAPREAVVAGFTFGAQLVQTTPLLRRVVLEDHSVRDALGGIGALFIEVVSARVAGTLRDCGATMPDDELLEAVELLVRLVLSYLEVPATDPDRATPDRVRRIATQHLAPMIH